MAVELCKVALWLEALEPGKPLTFLDHHIKAGNSLIGAPHTKTIPDLLHDGIPDDAYTALLGDDKQTTSAAKRRNREERGGQSSLFTPHDTDPGAEVARALRNLEASPDDDIQTTRAKEAAYHKLERQESFTRAHAIADAWTAAFFWPKRPGQPTPITTNDLHNIANGHALTHDRQTVIDDLRDRHRYFHWRIEYADVFHREHPGFDVVLGNPPWERIKLQEQEWFASRDEHIATAPNAAERKRRIKALQDDNPALYQAFQDDLRAAEAESQFARNSSNYPLNGRGDINTYALFAELDRDLTRATGRAGFIVPAGIATDHTTREYFGAVVDEQCLESLIVFKNERLLFPGLHHHNSFALVTLGGGAERFATFEVCWFAWTIAEALEPERKLTMSASDIALVNPNTRTAPIFKTRRDADITKRIYQRFPVLINEATGENPWGISFLRMFDMSNDSGLFRTRDQLEAQGYELDGNIFRQGKATHLPLYEAKMVHHFDHRFATYERDGTIRDTTVEEHQDPTFAPMPRYWVEESEVEERLVKRDRDGNVIWQWEQPWLLGFRRITNSTNERTAIFSLIPRVGAGDPLPVVFTAAQDSDNALLLGAMASSLVFDFVARQAVGGTHLDLFLAKQLPMPSPAHLPTSVIGEIASSALQLTCTDAQLASSLNRGSPQTWSDGERFALRARLDALCFHVFGLTRDEVEHVLDTFVVLRNRERSEFGSYRTKAAVLRAYDAMC